MPSEIQGKVMFEEALGTEALLLGRRSDEWFASRWADRPGEWADRLNSLPKYVVSSTLADPKWRNSTLLNGDVVEQVTKLKQDLDGDIATGFADRYILLGDPAMQINATPSAQSGGCALQQTRGDQRRLPWALLAIACLLAGVSFLRLGRKRIA